MRYAQFFHLSTGYVEGSVPPRFDTSNVKPIEACGSNGVHVLDARRTIASAHHIASEVCAKRGFVGYQIREGASFTQSRSVSPLIRI